MNDVAIDTTKMSLYDRLFSAIGVAYGVGDGSTTFNIPDLIDSEALFIKCWDGHSPFNVVEEAQVGRHKHALSGTTGNENSHTHEKGELRIRGTGVFSSTRITKKVLNGEMTGNYANFYSGAFRMVNASNQSFPDVNDDSQGTNGGQVVFDTGYSGAWIGTKTAPGTPHSHSLAGCETADYQGDSEVNTVRNKMMVPVIKY